MSLAAEDIADALQAIRDEGTPVTFVSVASTPIDPAKPWLGTNDVPSEIVVSMVFVDQAAAASLIAGWTGDAELASSKRFGMIGNNGFEPAVGQRVQRAGKEDLVVKDVMIAAPADVAVFYVLEFDA